MTRIYRFYTNFREVACDPGIVLGLVSIGSFPSDESDRTSDLTERIPRIDICMLGQLCPWSLRLGVFLIGIPRQGESTIHVPHGKFGTLPIERKAWRAFLLSEIRHRLLDRLENFGSISNRDVVLTRIAFAHRGVGDDELGQVVRKIG